MLRFFTKTFKRRTVSLLFFFGVLPYIVSGVVGIYMSYSALRTETYDKLTTVRDEKKARIVQYLEEKKNNILVLSESLEVMNIFQKITGTKTINTPLRDGRGSGFSAGINETEKEEKQYARAGNFLMHQVRVYGFRRLIFLDTEKAGIVKTIPDNSEAGNTQDENDGLNPGPAMLLNRIMETRKPVITDIYPGEKQGMNVFYVGAPVFFGSENIYGVVAAELDAEQIDRILQAKNSLGRTGQIYIVGEDRLLRSDTLAGQKNIVLEKRIRTQGAEQALEGKSGYDTLSGLSGEKDKLVAFAPFGLKTSLEASFEWAIVTEISREEAYEQLIGIFIWSTSIGILALLSISFGVWSAINSMIIPTERLAVKVNKMAEGDLTVDIRKTDREDELGILMNAFYNMLVMLRNQTQQIMEGTSTIASSISQISATATELAASATETSGSVSEITSTVEQIRQTAEISNSKATLVSQSADHAAQISETGKKATEDVISGMNRIKEEMSYVAESIVKLSDQTQSIGEIINAVNDLADQSNLLSVNAAIEAAKAGEQGKGFAVVAQEVKSLADQSKTATNQVRTILNDIQKATSAAVLATERGNKAVEAGVFLSHQTSESITALSNSVSESAQAASQIAASSQQQFIGMDQLADAMESIKDASHQNVDGARQLESATKDLNELGQRLKELCQVFKV